MNITGLRVQHTRSHLSRSFDFSSRVTVFVGKNGSGKTTLLEAMHIALRGSSFRGTDQEFLKKDATWWRIDLLNDEDDVRTIKFDSSKASGKKKIEIHNKVNYRMPQSKRKPTVLFEPDDLRLLSGSPARRRLFIDAFITQIDPLYTSVIRKYERALKQRNSLLKHPETSRDDVFVWDMAMSEYGAQIISMRTQIIERINREINTVYHSISQTDDQVSVHYSHTQISSVKQKLINELHHSFERDKMLGYSSVGPHRHDIIFMFNDSPATSVASRGEVRSIILALKFLEVDVAQEVTGEQPIILLDDVFAELDESRQRSLAEKCRDNQMFITSTGAYEDIDEASVISLD